MIDFSGLGAAFYPDQQPRDTWREYIKLMAEAGISFVRMGEFAWDKMEPREKEFNFTWLDEVFSMLAEKKIEVLLCTPTAVPPIWACRKYPEIHPVLRDGRTFGFGIRRYTCPTSPEYLSLCESIVTAMAKHYAGSNQVIGWQIDNEIGHPFCFCGRCLKRFQSWCEEKFHTIDEFNDAHVTHFWGQTLQSFDQIPFPDTAPSPSLWMSYHKFFSDMTIRCFGAQAEWLKKHDVKVPVTTNMMPTWYGYDHEEMAGRLDVIAGDHYSTGNIFGPDFAGEAFVNAYLRGMKGGAPIWFHEFQCAKFGDNSFPLPGQVRFYTLNQIGLGANRISYFRFDTCQSGQERDGWGLLKPSRQPGRIFEEVKQLTGDVKKLKPLLSGTSPAPAETAILYTYENHYEFAEYSKLDEFTGPAGNGYALHLAKHFKAIAGNNIPMDIVYPGQDFSRYKCIIAPALYVIPQKLGKKINGYVENGGNFLLTSFSGVVDENAKQWDIPIPGPAHSAFGIRVLDYGKYMPVIGELRLVSRVPSLPFPSFKISKWIDEILVDENTQILAVYSGKFFKDIPVLTMKKFGRGHGFYLGTLLEESDYQEFYRILLASLGIKPLMELSEGIHVAVRKKKGISLYFICNETPEAKEVDLPGSYTDALTAQKTGPHIALEPFGVRVLM